MNFIVSCLLKQISDEQDAFWALVWIMFEHNWREIFKQGNAKIEQLLSKALTRIQTQLPELFEHFEANELFTMEAGFTSHLVTLFKDSPQQQEQIFELFLLNGEKVLIDLIVSMLRVV